MDGSPPQQFKFLAKNSDSQLTVGNPGYVLGCCVVIDIGTRLDQCAFACDFISINSSIRMLMSVRDKKNK